MHNQLYYNSTIVTEIQRLSNNFCPKFSDEEAITIYLWGLANQKYEFNNASPKGEGLLIGGLNRRLKATRLKGGGFYHAPATRHTSCGLKPRIGK